MKSKIIFKLLIFFYTILFLNMPAKATSITLSPSQSIPSVKYWDPEANNGQGRYIYDYGNYDLGYLEGSATGNSLADIYRSLYVFNISDIPDNARIDSVILIGHIRSGHQAFQYKARFVGIPYKTLNDPGSVWNAVGSSGIIYLDNVDYDLDFNEKSEALKNVIQNNLSVDIVKIGLLSLNEDKNQSEGDLENLQLVIYYSISIQVTITTNPVGLQFYVDGVTYNSSQTFSWYSGDEHTIGTTSPQTYNGKTYVFKNWSDGGDIEHVIAPTSNETITATFAEVLLITVKNRWDGGYVKVDGVQYPSGSQFEFEQGSIHDFEAWQQNYGGYDMVFKSGQPKWDTPDGQFNTALIKDHAVQNAGTYEAQLWRVCNFTATNNFLNGGSGGIIKINGVSYNAPYFSTVLEADPITFEAPSQNLTVNGRNISYNLLEWENGSTQNPRTITKNTNFSITANYKGHLVSSTANAIGNNSQRKILYYNGSYYMVYEDNGEIYYTFSTDDGQSWSNEFRVSDGMGGNYSPSIAIDSNGWYLGIVWQQDEYIRLRIKKLSGWQSIQIIDSLLNSFPATPVIAFGMNNFQIVWRINNAFEKKLKIRAYDPSGNGYFGQKNSVAGSNNYSQNPTLTFDEGYRFHLAWEENGTIYYSKFNYDAEEERYYYDVSKQNVSSGAGYVNNVFPSISTNSRREAQITWQGHSIALAVDLILVASQNGSSWSYTSFVDDKFEYSYRQPVISGFPGFLFNQNNTLKVVWKRDIDNLLYLADFDGSNWGAQSLGILGFTPTLSTNNTTDNKIQMIYRQYNDAPYLLKNLDQSPGGSSSPTVQSNTLKTNIGYRFQIQPNMDINLWYELTRFRLNGNPFFFKHVNQGKNSGMVLLESNAFKVIQPVAMNFHEIVESFSWPEVQKWVGHGNDLLVQMVLVDAITNEPIRIVRTFNMSVNKFKSHRDSVQVMFTPNKDYLKVQFILESSNMNIKAPLIKVNYVGNIKVLAENMLPEKGLNLEKVNMIPKKFRLFSNYPNPFNPSTTIRFDLPKAVDVQLTVYDIAGRRITTLQNGHLSAGEHRVVWDGRDDAGNTVASGVYIYRLQAGEFDASRKMLLVR